MISFISDIYAVFRNERYFAEENGIYSFSVLFPFFFDPRLVSRAPYYETFRGSIAAISLAPSARSGRAHAHVKGVVQQTGLKRQVA